MIEYWGMEIQLIRSYLRKYIIEVASPFYQYILRFSQHLSVELLLFILSH
jgi:hypothetical protein